MCYFRLLAGFCFVLLTHQAVQALTALERAEYEPLFHVFIQNHDKTYTTNNEYSERFNIFVKNMKRARELQKSQQGTARYGATPFSDLTATEFKQRYAKLNTTLQNGHNFRKAKIPNLRLPKSFDWRKRKAVTPVKQQGLCGSCWAFSATGNIEGLYAIKHKELLSFSEQQLVDCDKLDGGCDGGLMTEAFRSIIKLGGLELEDKYPYTGTNGSCAFKKSKVAVKLSGGVILPANEKKMAKWLVKHGPISIGLNSDDMMLYTGGISRPKAKDCNPHTLDHGVLIVGFGTSKNIPYWIVKNNWGPSWGENGYYRVYRGAGVCGLHTLVSSAVLK